MCAVAHAPPSTVRITSAEHTGKCALKRLFAVENKVKHESFLLPAPQPRPNAPACPASLGRRAAASPHAPAARHDGGCHRRYQILTQANKESYSPRGDPLDPEDEEEDEDEEAVATTDEGSTNSAKTKQANDGMITNRESCLLGETGETVSSVGTMLDIADTNAAFPATSADDFVVAELDTVGVP